MRAFEVLVGFSSVLEYVQFCLLACLHIYKWINLDSFILNMHPAPATYLLDGASLEILGKIMITKIRC